MRYYNFDGVSKECDLRVARKENLLPSVTTVLGIMDKYGLDEWKCQQVAIACAKKPFDDVNDSLDEYVQTMVKVADESREKAASFGTQMHTLVQAFIQQDSEQSFNFHIFENTLEKDVVDKFNAVKDVLFKGMHQGNISNQKCELSIVNEQLGYAGRYDYYFERENGDRVLVDYKTQNTKPKRKPNIYKEWRWQLAAYGLVLKPTKYLSVVISSSELGRIDFIEHDAMDMPQHEREFEAINRLYRMIKDFPYNGKTQETVPASP